MPIFTQEDLRKQAERDAARNVGASTESLFRNISGANATQTGVQPAVTPAPTPPATDPFKFGDQSAFMQQGVRGDQNNIVGAPQPTLTPTPEGPVKTIGPTTEPGKQLTINDVLFKQSRGEQLNREEFDFATNFLMKQQEDQRQALISAEQEKIKAAQAFAPQAEKFATERAKTAEEQFQQQLSAGTTAIHQKFQPLFTGVEEAGKKQREAQQSIFSFSGFGRSTDAATKAGEIEAATSNALQKLEAARQAETAALRASLMGEKADTVNALSANVEKLKSEAKAVETEALAQIQQLNAQNSVFGTEAIGNIMQVLGKTAPDKVSEIDASASKGIGRLIRKDGTFVTDNDGNAIAFGLDEAEKTKYQFHTNPLTGDELIFDPVSGNIINRSEGVGELTDGGGFGPGQFGGGGVSDLGIRVPKMTAGISFGPRRPAIGDSLAVRNSNPGNLRRSSLAKSESGGFAQFDTMEDGFNALMQDVLAKQTGQTKTGLGPDSSLLEFFNTYAPSSDGNDPNNYANTVARYLKVDPNTMISEIPTAQLAKEISRHEDINAFNSLFGGSVAPSNQPRRDTARISSYSSGPLAERALVNPADYSMPEILLMARNAGIDIQDKTKRALVLENAKLGILPKQILNRKDKLDAEKDLRKEFDTESRIGRTAIGQAGIIESAYEEAKRKSALGQGLNAASQGVLVAFQKLIDPQSVVRESEFARSAEGVSLMGRMEGKLQQWLQGGAGVKVEDLFEFVEMGRKFSQGYQKSMVDYADRTRFLARRDELDEEAIFTPDILRLLNVPRGSTIQQQPEPVNKDLLNQLSSEQAAELRALGLTP